MTAAHVRIVVVCPTLLDHDAVGAATAALYRDLSLHPNCTVTLLSRRTERSDTPVTIVHSLGDLLMNREFLEADLIIYVFAIYNELFDAMLIGNGQARQVVRFHNVTPLEFVDSSQSEIIIRSLNQLRNFDVADEIWADSQENMDELSRRRIAKGRAVRMPISVEPLVEASLMDKPANEIIRIIYVGRFVPSKGIIDLIAAISNARDNISARIKVRMLGNVASAPKDYLEKIKYTINEHNLESVIDVNGPVSAGELRNAYRCSHVFMTASHHEGFCVPVIEALAAGCVPVTYRNSNLRHISGGLGRLSAEDSPESLAMALVDVVRAMTAPSSVILPLDRGETPAAEFDNLSSSYLRTFAPDVCAERMTRRVVELLSTPRRDASSTARNTFVHDAKA